MKFVVEAAGLTVAGGKELALDLMAHLAGHTEHNFTFLVPDLEAYKAISDGNIRTIVCRKGSGLWRRARLLNQEVPRICREEKADALLCLGNFVPNKHVCPTAVLLQNAWIVYDDPVAESRRTPREHLITAYGRHAYRHLPGDIAVITQTPVMKDHLCRRYGIAPGRVAIIPNTLSLPKVAGSPECGPSGENEPFTFLCLAHCYAHKNIDILLDAAQRLPNYTGKPAKCVITVAPGQHPRARRLLERLGKDGLTGKIENIGPVPSQMLSQVYRRADALIFPTLLESFSRTYSEAMYFGLPILTSDRDFARHLCQNAATYFDPLDADSVAQSMARVMQDGGLRARLVENGRRLLAQAPTWDEIARSFVELLERTARNEPPLDIEPRSWHTVRSFRVRQLATAFSPASLLAANPASNRDFRNQTRGEESGSKLPHSKAPHSSLTGVGHGVLSPRATGPLDTSTANDVRTLFNQKARDWRSKYGPDGKLNSRVEQFKARLAELCPPPARVLDLGCGTGEISAAIDQMGYHVTACDFAEDMLHVARRSHSGTAVNWVCLEPSWELLPFEDASFDAIIASSVFEYLDDVPRVAKELSRVLRPDGVLLLTVPNPWNSVRKIEARLQSSPFAARLSLVLRRFRQIDSYAAYLRLSRNRYDAEEWQSLLGAAHFAALDENDSSPKAWQQQARAPLVLLAVKKLATGYGRDFEAEAALCRPVAG
ncbi:MAG: methyltransferase domain-containing protein [Terriglobia bacterium]